MFENYLGWSPPNRRKADDSYCGIDRGGSVYPEPTRLVDACLPTDK
jgi:hypothetical protein